MPVENIALDAKSMRHIDSNGFMHLDKSPLTKEQVAPYRGFEVPDYQRFQLEPNKIYHVYRPAQELRDPETLKSMNNIPIQLNHHIEDPDNPPNDTRVGSTGTDAKWSAPYVTNSLAFYDKRAIELIESGAMRELSLGYSYDPEFKPGTFKGKAYDFVMRNIRANHLALVEQGRAGHDVLVLDAKPSHLSAKKDKLTMDENNALAQMAQMLSQMSELCAQAMGGQAAGKQDQLDAQDDELDPTAGTDLPEEESGESDLSDAEESDDFADSEDVTDEDGAEFSEDEDDPDAAAQDEDEFSEDEDELSEDGDDEPVEDEDDSELAQDEDDLSEDEGDELSEDEDEACAEDEDELSEDEDDLADAEDEECAEDEDDEPAAPVNDDDAFDVTQLSPEIKEVLKQTGMLNASPAAIKFFLKGFSAHMQDEENSMDKVTGDSAANLKRAAKVRDLRQRIDRDLRYATEMGKLKKLVQDAALGRKSAPRTDKAKQRAAKAKQVQDAALQKRLDTARKQAAKIAERKLANKFQAVQDTKNVLGKRDPFTCDSALGLYREAIRKVTGKPAPKGLSLKDARSLFLAKRATRQKSAKPKRSRVMDSASRSLSGGSNSVLDNFFTSRLY